MSYPPQPYPPQYGYPPGYPQPSQIGMTAKWAGIVAIIVGVLAILMGGCFIALVPQMLKTPELHNDPNMSRAFEQLAQMGMKPEVLFYTMSGIFIGYGVVMAIVGAILLLVRSKAGPIIGLVVVIPITLLLLLNILPALLQAHVPAILVGLLMLMPHVLILFWLTQALRAGPQMPMMYPGYPGYMYPQQPPPQPMQGYYQPPKQ